MSGHEDQSTEAVAHWAAAHDLPAYQVGRWIWCEFQSKPSAEIRTALKERGFRWNKGRNVWQHACGFPTRQAPYDPRGKYGRRDIGEDERNHEREYAGIVGALQQERGA